MDFTFVVLQVQGNVDYPMGLDYSLGEVDCIVPLIYGFILCVDLIVGILGMIAP